MSIIVDHLSYIYEEGTAYERAALADINIVINDNEFVGIIGHTGSGKSTLIQHLNGLIRPTSGTVYYNGEDIFDKDYSLKKLRSKVGIVFQYPEYQLFEATVIDDVKFGPANIGMNRLDVDIAAYDALKKVKIPDDIIDVSPLELSGGEKRRVAIAGVLAMKPDVLILDEPTAGLDPVGRDEILNLIDELHRMYGMTIILVSHSMEEIAKYADRLIVINDGRIYADDKPEAIYNDIDALERIGLAAPQTLWLMKKLHAAGMNVRDDISDPDIAVEEIARSLGAGLK